MNNEVMKADNHEPDYRNAMLFHSDRADQYAAERDAAVAQAATLRAEVERLRGAGIALRDDMLERSRAGIDTIHGEEYRIVNAGRTAWGDFCAALEGKA